MGSKNIRLSDEAYLKLARIKGSNESFTDVINRLTKRNNILDLIGLLSKSEARELKNGIDEIWKDSNRRMEEI